MSGYSKISKDAARALMAHKNFRRSNTKVIVGGDGAAYMKLFGNTIVCHEADGRLKISSAGYRTMTTKCRLNALPHVSIQQRKFVWYLNDEPWDGDWDMVYNPDPRGKQWGRAPQKTDDTVEESIVDIKSSNGE
ncbi:MAG: hypothetical protein CMI60_08995 [Parvibaculum sp.]|nr:hypothetical protein [Parvibaculum sp.]